MFRISDYGGKLAFSSSTEVLKSRVRVLHYVDEFDARVEIIVAGVKLLFAH